MNNLHFDGEIVPDFFSFLEGKDRSSATQAIASTSRVLSLLTENWV